MNSTIDNLIPKPHGYCVLVEKCIHNPLKGRLVHRNVTLHCYVILHYNNLTLM